MSGEIEKVENALDDAGNPLIPDPNQAQVHLYTATWARESHGLFDYEARNPIKKQFALQQQSTILRRGTDVVVNQNAGPEPSESLARLTMKNNKFYVDAARNTEGRPKSGKLWRVVKDLASGYNLQENDSIKLGRFKLRVRQVICPDANETPVPICAAVNPPALPPRACNTGPEMLAELEHTCCRICLLEGSSEEDPLIQPCSCKGTIAYVHLGCLRHWVRGKLDLSESSAGTYFYKPMSCELCKTVYATHLADESKPGTSFPLIELPKTMPPFIVLERDSNRPELKGVHVISLSEKKLLKLGRGHESDVRFADVSISRWHATVHFDGDKSGFVLTDHGSKFGTLVAMRTPVAIDASQNLSLQAGRTVLHFAVHQPGDPGHRAFGTFGTTLTNEGGGSLGAGPMDVDSGMPSNNHGQNQGGGPIASGLTSSVLSQIPTFGPRVMGGMGGLLSNNFGGFMSGSNNQQQQSNQPQHNFSMGGGGSSIPGQAPPMSAAGVNHPQQAFHPQQFGGGFHQNAQHQQQNPPNFSEEPEALLALRLSLLSHNQNGDPGQPGNFQMMNGINNSSQPIEQQCFGGDQQFGGPSGMGMSSAPPPMMNGQQNPVMNMGMMQPPQGMHNQGPPNMMQGGMNPGGPQQNTQNMQQNQQFGQIQYQQGANLQFGASFATDAGPDGTEHNL